MTWSPLHFFSLSEWYDPFRPDYLSSPVVTVKEIPWTAENKKIKGISTKLSGILAPNNFDCTVPQTSKLCV